MGLNMHEKKALAREASKRYQKAGRKDKTRILDELAKTTDYNRKYALHLLANWGKSATALMGGQTIRLEAAPHKRRNGGGRKPVYSGEFAAVLRRVWAFLWYRRGRYWPPFMRQQMPFLELPFRITPGVGKPLLPTSPPAIDRALEADKNRLAIKGKSCTRPGSLLEKQIPVRAYYVDAGKKPGFFYVNSHKLIHYYFMTILVFCNIQFA
ncbi:MAG: hypothetical protein LBQ69_05010 [Treponema sp.]|jgi:hypothetical protein|nr:hypothetical protein [Treponema sp.]